MSDELTGALRAHLLTWLPRQGWFDAVDGEIDDVTVLRAEPLRASDPDVLWVPAEVVVDGTPVTCQTVVALAPVVPECVPQRAILGEVSRDGGALMAYDAITDPGAAKVFVDHIGGTVAPASAGDVADEPWLTTLTLSPQWELTLYRRVEAGAHPDVELPSVIAETDASLVRPPAAVWRKNRFDLAAVRRTPRRRETGTALADASVRDVLRRRCRPEDSSLDLAESLQDLGAVLARAHVASADRLGASMVRGRDLAWALIARLPRRLDDAAAQRVAAAYRRLGDADDLGVVVRVHGNLGLGSVERSRDGWALTRFGCHPDSSLMFEQQPLPPLSDVAALLHSLKRVAADALDDVAGAEPDDSDLYDRSARRELGVLAEAWDERCAAAVVAGYTSNEDVHRLLPVERVSRDALLTLFELEQSVRDVARRIEVRTDVVRIPLEEVVDLTTSRVRSRW